MRERGDLDRIDLNILRILSRYDHLTPLQVWFELGEDDLVKERATGTEIRSRLDSLETEGFVEAVATSQVGKRPSYIGYRLKRKNACKQPNQSERRAEMSKKPPSKSRTKNKKVKFSFHAPDAQVVSLAGDFNNWNVAALSMKRDTIGTWKADIHLAPGTYEYRFYSDGEWQDDPKASSRVANPFGSHNCVRIVS